VIKAEQGLEALETESALRGRDEKEPDLSQDVIDVASAIRKMRVLAEVAT
jgi:hypothetical protein